MLISRLDRVIHAIRLAMAFLTIIPVRWSDGRVTETDLSESRYAYPVIGGAIGLVLAVLSETIRLRGIDPTLAAFLLIAAEVAITGGLHLDGLADTSDGLFLWGDASRRLAVLRDPHVGSFGVSAIVLVLLGKYAALSHMTGPGRSLAVLGAATVGRTLILVAAGTARYARLEGTGRILIDATTPRDALGAALGTLALGAALAGRTGLVASGAALTLAWCLTRLASHKLGGITGDILGALIELTELVFLVTWM